VLDDSPDANNRDQLLISVQGVNNRFDVITEIFSTQPMKGTKMGEDFYERLSTLE
jgi:hypothetical protein